MSNTLSRIVRLIVVAGMMVAPSAVNAEILLPTTRWVCPSDYDGPVGVIVEKKRERFFARTKYKTTDRRSIPYGPYDKGKAFPYDIKVWTAFFLYPASYAVVRRRLPMIVQEQFGVDKTSEHNHWNAEEIHISLLKRTDSSEDFIKFKRSTFDRDKSEMIGQLKSLGYEFDDFRATEILTKRYNLLPSRDGYSQSVIYILDGKNILRR